MIISELNQKYQTELKEIAERSEGKTTKKLIEIIEKEYLEISREFGGTLPLIRNARFYYNKLNYQSQ